MGIESTETLNITCDNPSCPGTDLSATDRLGWCFASVEIYGEAVVNGVFCGLDCLAVVAAAHDGALAIPAPEVPA